MVDLKACPNPWCKPTMVPITISLPDVTGAHTLVAKMCWECGCTAPSAKTADEAIATWNTRPDPSPTATPAWCSADLPCARAERMRAALQECVRVMELVEKPSILDPDYTAEIEELGDRIGYGVLMSGASACWRRIGKKEGFAGGEFVAGHCQITVDRTLALARAALKEDTDGTD